MRYLVPGPLPCPEVVAVFYIRPAEVPTLFCVEGDAQVKHQNTVVGFLTRVRGAMLVWQDDDWGMHLEECGVGCSADKK